MLTGVQGVDVEEGLEESLQSLSLVHVPQVRSHDSHMCGQCISLSLCQQKEPSSIPAVFREQQLSTKVSTDLVV